MRIQLFFTAMALPAAGIQIRSYNPALHDRFTGTPMAPAMNPGFLYDPAKFTGVARGVLQGHKQFAMVSPRHFVCATHFKPSLGHAIRFVDSGGVVLDRAVSTLSEIAVVPGAPTDLTLGTLASPVPVTVSPLPYLNLASEPAYENTELVVFGHSTSGTSPRAGRGSLINFYTADLDATGPQGNTRIYNFEYDPAASGDNDCHLESGDSGSPTFAMVGGVPALVGIHSTVAPPDPTIFSYDTFIPHYIPQLDPLLAPSGHRMMPVNFTPTTLSIPSATPSPATLRRSHPGSISFSVANTGAELTGNLSVTVIFPAGQQPSSLSAPGWVAESLGSGAWNLRAATFAGGASLSFTATWTDLPNLAAITPAINADSDTAPAVVSNPSFTLVPSYAEWSEGLAQPGQTADPDGDSLENLLEYAFGGDAESGAMILPGGHPLLPVMTHQAGTVTLSYPERDDAVLRGLSYVVETATSPATLAGATTLPAGASSSTAPFSPAVPGFVKRTISWPTDGPRRFARVKVSLSE